MAIFKEKHIDNEVQQLCVWPKRWLRGGLPLSFQHLLRTHLYELLLLFFNSSLRKLKSWFKIILKRVETLVNRPLYSQLSTWKVDETVHISFHHGEKKKIINLNQQTCSFWVWPNQGSLEPQTLALKHSFGWLEHRSVWRRELFQEWSLYNMRCQKTGDNSFWSCIDEG